jgi:hypothetical protein
MKTKQLICASIIASATSFAGSALAEPTLWGFYGAHSPGIGRANSMRITDREAINHPLGLTITYPRI